MWYPSQPWVLSRRVAFQTVRSTGAGDHPAPCAEFPPLCWTFPNLTIICILLQSFPLSKSIPPSNLVLSPYFLKLRSIFPCRPQKIWPVSGSMWITKLPAWSSSCLINHVYASCLIKQMDFETLINIQWAWWSIMFFTLSTVHFSGWQ